MKDGRMELPEKAVVGGVLVLLFFVLGQFLGDGARNTRRAREMVAHFCGENTACVEKAAEHLEECVEWSSTRSGRSSISMDEASFSECIRTRLGIKAPHRPPVPG